MDRSNELTIVAVPRAGDPIWKISSEKVPHLTILYLGDSVSPENTLKIKSFVEHASKVSLNRFGLLVDRRGELGDKKADVLFFDKDFTSKVAQFRDMLLLNDTIQQAYHSTEQYPTWTPHLTLGYPDTPAMEIENTPHSWVEFDRIAVWDEDYKGLEITLTAQGSLAHYGVKGMKWGVRKKESSPDGTIRSRYKTLRTRELRTHSATTKSGETVTATEVREAKIGSAISALSPKLYKQLNDSVNVDFTVGGRKVGNGSFEKRSDDEMYLNWIGVKQSERGKGYASAMFDVGIEYSKAQGVTKLTLEVPGKAPDARHIYEKRGFKVSGPMEGDPSDTWGGLFPMSLDISDQNIRHADDEALELEKALLQHFDILYQGLNPFEGDEEMGHIERGANFLEHYGVKGMKWGVRRSQSQLSRVGSKKTTKSADAKKAEEARKKAKKQGAGSLSNKEMQALVNRMNLEQQYSKLTSKSSIANKLKTGHKATKSVLAAGATINTAIAFANSPAGKILKARLKG